MKKMSFMGFDIQIDTNLFVPIDVYDEENPCCKNKPFVLRKNLITVHPNMIIYSCQCSCGSCSTKGFSNPNEAVKEYRGLRLNQKESIVKEFDFD